MEERAGVSSMLDLSTLEARCMSEIENDGFRDLTNAQFSLELLRHATSQGNQESTGVESVSAFSNTLFSDALLIPLLHTNSAIMGIKFVLFSHHPKTDIVLPT